MIAKSTDGCGAALRSRRDEMGALFARCRRLLWSAAHQELARRGGTLWTFQVLTHLEREQALTQGDLALATVQHPAAISRLLAELEDQGLVRRRRDRADRRRMLVELTARGRELHQAHRVYVNAAVDGCLAVLSRSEQESLHQLLGKLADSAEPACAAPARPAVRRPARRRS
jgi:DNA-binding MarR family transcriptional regulator